MSEASSAVMTAFEAKRQGAKQAWQGLKAQPLILVGTATCGRAAGALPVKEKILAELQVRQLEATVLEVGCMGHCYAEPLVVISKPGFPAICYAMLTRVSPAGWSRISSGTTIPAWSMPWRPWR